MGEYGNVPSSFCLLFFRGKIKVLLGISEIPVIDLNLHVISNMQLLKLLKNTENFTNDMQMEFVRNKCNNKMEKWANNSLLL